MTIWPIRTRVLSKLCYKTEYFSKKVEDASHDQLFKFVDKFLNVKKAPILPKHESSKELAERFSENFQTKREEMAFLM